MQRREVLGEVLGEVLKKCNSLITIELAKNRGGLGENNKFHSFLALIRFILGKKGRIS